MVGWLSLYIEEIIEVWISLCDAHEFSLALGPGGLDLLFCLSFPY